MTDPKPCPFCGSCLQDVLVGADGTGWAEHPKADCYLSEYQFSEFDLAAWNERHCEIEVTKLRARLGAVQRFLDGECRMVDGKPAALPKTEQCDHGEYSWTECGTCTDIILETALEGYCDD